MKNNLRLTDKSVNFLKSSHIELREALKDSNNSLLYVLKFYKQSV